MTDFDAEINTVVIVPYIKTLTHTKKTNLANIQISGPHAWLKETFRFDRGRELLGVRLSLFSKRKIDTRQAPLYF